MLVERVRLRFILLRLRTCNFPNVFIRQQLLQVTLRFVVQ